MNITYKGEAVKFVEDTKIKGLAVKFTTSADPDLYQDFFTSNCDFGLSLSHTLPIYFNHCFDGILKTARIGEAKLTKKNDGIFVDGFIYNLKNCPENLDKWSRQILKERAEYIDIILKLIETGKMGYSTGSAPHLVKKKSFDNGTNEITKWDIVELSITHTPAEPRTYATKSAINDKFDWSQYLKIGAKISNETATSLIDSLENLNKVKKTIETLLAEYKNINININKIKMDGTTTDLTRVIDLLTARFDAVEMVLLEINAGVALLLEQETKEALEEVTEVTEPTEAIMTADEIIKKINKLI